MKKFFTLLVVAIFTTTALIAQTVTKNYNFSGFDAINVSSIYDVHITKGNSNVIEVICSKAISEHLNIYVSNGTLFLSTNRIPKKISKMNNEITVKMQMDKLNNVSMSGASSLWVNGEYDSETFKLSMSGASDIKSPLNINTTLLYSTLSGASQAEVRGTFKQINSNNSGAASIEISGSVQTVIINASGASDVEYKGNIEQTCKIESTGAAEVTLKGSVPAIEIKCSGAANVDAKDMIAKTATASASGASYIKVHGDDLLNLKTSGSSKIKYYGKAAQVNVQDNSIIRGSRD